MSGIISYVKRIGVWLCIVIACETIMIITMMLNKIPFAEIGYGIFISLFLLLILLAFDAMRYYRHYRKVKELEHTIMLSTDGMPENADLLENEYQKLLRILSDEYTGAQSRAATRQKNMQEYYAMWVHQVKTPIAALRLLLQNKNDEGQMTEELSELFGIEQYVEMALQYQRLDSETTDFVFEETDIFVSEACEYTNSFLHFYPRYSVILNVEAEHLDFFKDIQDIRNSFRKFAGNTKKDGAIIINGEIENYTELTSGLDPQVITFGLNDSCDYYPSDITFDETACASFTAMHHGTPVMDVKLHVPGMHNVSNALAAIALSLDLGISTDAILAGLSAFGGADRRFQYKGCVDGVTIIDDYAHHPTEIRATLTAAKNYPHKRLVLAFQPHTYSRAKAFLDDFADVLSMADVVVLADIYAAREKNTYGISSRDILAKLKEKGTECYYFPSFEEIEKFLLKNCINGDLLITMGAGDIVNVGEHLLGR